MAVSATRNPELPNEAPSPAGNSSMTSTEKFRRSSCSAALRPTTPAPMTVASRLETLGGKGVLTMIGRLLGRSPHLLLYPDDLAIMQTVGSMFYFAIRIILSQCGAQTTGAQ